ncbi:MAG: histidine kinase N-terminal 7TM domain-containing protein [Lachnospiraceae bacterium]|nr:histidine kinase N-terminal 7TM domain-containing protein [Lachnospiraceae bacterium]
MEHSRESIVCNVVCVLLFVGAWILRQLIQHNGRSYSYNSMILVLIAAAILIWAIQLRRRLLATYIRSSLTAAAVLMLFWMILRTIKYEFLPEESELSRYIWYLYYIPMIFIPLLMFLSALHIGKSDRQTVSRGWKLLYSAAYVLAVSVLTNDVHQKVFFFPEGLSDRSDIAYIHGPVYYMVVVWMAVLFAAMLVIVFSRCAVSSVRKKIWVPMIPLAMGIVYTALYLTDSSSVALRIMTLPETGCFLFAAFMESLILIHLVPSNDNYGEFWNAASLRVGIMDLEGKICYASERSIPFELEQVKRAEDQDVFQESGNLVLRSSRIPGGYCYWTKDISYINTLNNSLSELGDVLEEENVMLRAEQKLLQEQERIRRQNELYDAIAQKIRPRLDQISRILEEPDRDDEEFIREMKYACILNAYVKRYSNLLLMARQNTYVDSGELWLALSESLNHVELYGVKACGSCQGASPLPGDQLLILYELFEYILESAIPGAAALFVNLVVLEEELSLRMTLETPREFLTEELLKVQMTELCGTVHLELEQQTEYVSLLVPIRRIPV